MDLTVALSNSSENAHKAWAVMEEVRKSTFEYPRPRRRQFQNRLTPNQIIELVDRYQKGERAYLLARDFNVSRKTVPEILKREGVPVRPRSLTPDQVKEAKKLRKRGWSYACIGKHLSKNHGTVWLALKPAGPRRDKDMGDR